MIVVICGPSGVGKGSIIDGLLSRDPTLVLSRSWTTRPRRPVESEDAYHFVERATFEEHIAAGGFLEWNEHFDNLYGTPRPDATATPGRDLLLEIEVDGAAQVRQQHPDAVIVYIAAPSRDEQEARLRSRGERDDVVTQRLSRADYEDEKGRRIADAVVVNDVLDRAVEEVAGIIQGHRSSRPEANP